MPLAMQSGQATMRPVTTGKTLFNIMAARVAFLDSRPLVVRRVWVKHWILQQMHENAANECSWYGCSGEFWLLLLAGMAKP